MKVSRIQYEITPKQREAIENLMDETGIRTKRDLLNIALTLFEWAVHERKAGRTIASVDEENKKLREIVMPGVPIF